VATDYLIVTDGSTHFREALKPSASRADDALYMITPVSNNSAHNLTTAPPPAQPKAQPQGKSTLPNDTVTLKSAGGDHNHGNK